MEDKIIQSPFYITDELLKEIKELIADLPPEQGGALLGPRGSRLMTQFVFDSKAHTTSATYNASRNLDQIVKKKEQEHGVVFKGIVHSHPGGYDSPSWMDVQTVEGSLHTNQHMEFFIAPIVTVHYPNALANHELSLGDNRKISFYGGFREKLGRDKPILSNRSTRTFSLEKLDIKKIPLLQIKEDIRKCSRLFGEEADFRVLLIEQEEGEPFITAEMKVGETLEFFVSCDIHYPHSPPRILRIDHNQVTELEFNWEADSPCHYGLYRAMTKSSKKKQIEVPKAPKECAVITETSAVEEEAMAEKSELTTSPIDTEDTHSSTPMEEESPDIPTKKGVLKFVQTFILVKGKHLFTKQKHDAGGKKHVKSN
ncbi:Mov34/MPN/PAD-1 family protein [Niallia endozanthoxylica]|uniref:Mov34/MPN/PAD-1 family protein n=1 Tax=Niallia endozanthoxylica TaxID=2036016 RepID=UPI00168AE8DD|nr:Mov34/MPN/PAD-1 family protein [Niallia endozanthoxylica]